MRRSVGLKSVILRNIKNWPLLNIAEPYGPARIYWIVALAVFIVELLIMVFLMVLPPMPPFVEAVVDSVLLVFFVAPVFFLFLFRPLTSHIARSDRHAEQLRNSKDMLQTVFDGISDPLMLLDDELRVKMLNQSAIEYYDVDLDRVVDIPCHEAFEHHDFSSDECHISEATQSNRTVTFERPSAVDPGGTEQVVIYRSAAKDGKSGAVIIRISDVTEAKAMERQMIRQEKMASLGLLISSVAHEINNPNNMISLNLPILRDYLEAILPAAAESENRDAFAKHLNLSFLDIEKDAFELVRNIEHGSDRITAIVSQLKEFSRIEKHKVIKAIDLHDVIEKSLTICGGEIKRYIASLEVDIPDDFPKIHTNGEYLEQVLVNLIINACHAADKVDAWIKLRVLQGDTWDAHVIIEVSDNGQGMKPETIENIFEPLFTTRDRKGGTGLGLYVSYNLVENLGGRIEVQSNYGQGSTFRVYLTDKERRSRKRRKRRNNSRSESGQ